MNPALKTYWLTTLLVAICIILYVIQVLTGVDAGNPTSTDLLKWGANHVLMSFDIDTWRMLTSVFLHVGFMHLAFNTYALYLFGQITEHMLGRWFYVALFLLSGIGGNMMNNSYTTLMLAQEMAEGGQAFPTPVSAGASGGIMGLGAALLVFALLKVQPKGTKLHLKTLMWVMGINLSLGFVIPGIDNAAHIGGALTGGLMALIYAVFYKQGNHTNQKQIKTLSVVGKAVALFTVAGVWFYIYQYMMANHTDTIQQSIIHLQRLA